MNFNNLNVVELVRIQNVELHEVKGHSGKMINKGDLSLLYSQDFKWYILNINDFSFGLSKNIPVLASSREEGAAHTYVLTNPEGYYIIKVLTVNSPGAIHKFEDILKANTEFLYKQGSGSDEGEPAKLNETLQIRKSVSEGQRPQLEPEKPLETGSKFSPAHLVYNGGKATKGMIVGSAQAISKGISAVGGLIEKSIDKGEEVKINPSTISRVNFLNKITSKFSAATGFYVRGLNFLGNWLSRRIEPKFEQKKHDAEVKELKESPKDAGTVGHAAIHSAVSIWGGMLEALDIIKEGITDTTTSLVTHRYGCSAGELFRSGVGVATNIGLPGSKFFKKAN